MATLDLGNQCVWCQQDTAFGSGKYVNRISVSTDSESVDWLTEAQVEQYDTVEGMGCAECYEDDITYEDEAECACPSCMETELWSQLFCQDCFDRKCSESEDNH